MVREPTRSAPPEHLVRVPASTAFWAEIRRRGVGTCSALYAARRLLLENAPMKTPAVPQTSPRTLTSSLAALAALAVGLCFATGCGRVAPYERAKLAHPTMTGDMTGFAEAHIRSINEGAVGGSGGSGSGCGCN